MHQNRFRLGLHPKEENKGAAEKWEGEDGERKGRETPFAFTTLRVWHYLCMFLAW